MSVDLKEKVKQREEENLFLLLNQSKTVLPLLFCENYVLES